MGLFNLLSSLQQHNKAHELFNRSLFNSLYRQN